MQINNIIKCCFKRLRYFDPKVKINQNLHAHVSTYAEIEKWLRRISESRRIDPPFDVVG